MKEVTVKFTANYYFITLSINLPIIFHFIINHFIYKIVKWAQKAKAIQFNNMYNEEKHQILTFMKLFALLLKTIIRISK